LKYLLFIVPRKSSGGGESLGFEKKGFKKGYCKNLLRKTYCGGKRLGTRQENKLSGLVVI